MEVHAHTHSPRKKWTHYLWEFLMLFLAVFCGFTAENLREHRIEHLRAKEFAKMLKLDLMNDTLSLSDLGKKMEQETERWQFIGTLMEKELPNITIGELRRADTSNFLYDFFISKNVTFEQMTHAGQLRYFQNTELLISLGHYDWSVKHYMEMKTNLQNVFGGMGSEHMLQYIIKREQFLKQMTGKNDTTSVLKQGYKFDSWYENKKITETRFFLYQFLKESLYPDLKKQAINLIELLNKEYNLK